MSAITGGCQCGAVRYRCEALGRASICHCRMCQKAFGAFYGPLVTSIGLQWTRGEPSHFKSSNKVRRGFCAACGPGESGRQAVMGRQPARIAGACCRRQRRGCRVHDGHRELPASRPRHRYLATDMNNRQTQMPRWLFWGLVAKGAIVVLITAAVLWYAGIFR